MLHPVKSWFTEAGMNCNGIAAFGVRCRSLLEVWCVCRRVVVQQAISLGDIIENRVTGAPHQACA